MARVSVTGWTEVADADSSDFLIQAEGGDVRVSFAAEPSEDDGFILQAGQRLYIGLGDKAYAKAIAGACIVVAQAVVFPGAGGD